MLLVLLGNLYTNVHECQQCNFDKWILSHNLHACHNVEHFHLPRMFPHVSSKLFRESHQSDFSLLVIFVWSRTSHKWNHTPVTLPSFVQHNFCEVHPYFWLIPFLLLLSSSPLWEHWFLWWKNPCRKVPTIWWRTLTCF